MQASALNGRSSGRRAANGGVQGLSLKYSEQVLRVVFCGGPSLLDAVGEFTRLTGRPQVPPAWAPHSEKRGYAFAVWLADIGVWCAGADLSEQHMAACIVQSCCTRCSVERHMAGVIWLILRCSIGICKYTAETLLANCFR